MARPTTYTPELIATICERMANGEPLAAICRDDGFPHPTTVRDWMAAREDVALAIARARENGEDIIAADCLNIADENGNDIRYTEKGVAFTDGDVIQRSKLRIDTRLKLLAKWNPKKYGERLELAGEVKTDNHVHITREVITKAPS